jgi:hypothetical protein
LYKANKAQKPFDKSYSLDGYGFRKSLGQENIDVIKCSIPVARRVGFFRIHFKLSSVLYINRSHLLATGYRLPAANSVYMLIESCQKQIIG